jgi:hypothetical protein
LVALEALPKDQTDETRRAALAVRMGYHADAKEFQRFMGGGSTQPKASGVETAQNILGRPLKRR